MRKEDRFGDFVDIRVQAIWERSAQNQATRKEANKRKSEVLQMYPYGYRAGDLRGMCKAEMAGGSV